MRQAPNGGSRNIDKFGPEEKTNFNDFFPKSSGLDNGKFQPEYNYLSDNNFNPKHEPPRWRQRHAGARTVNTIKPLRN